MPIEDNKILMSLLSEVHRIRALDFTQYKERMLLRRIDARMAKVGLKNIEGYIEYIKVHHEEIDELVDSFGVNVTDFFRNPDSFRAIENLVLPKLIEAKRRKSHRLIRIWSCGCSIGDEPYSMAMLLNDALESSNDGFTVTIIGTDIDKAALDTAKSSTYTRERLKALDDEKLDKYFDMIGEDDYRIKPKIRSTVLFRLQDMINDKPIKMCDMILCRNVLIYFNKSLQEEILLKFYECMNPGGYLVLGMYETLIGDSRKRFVTVDNRLRVYQRPEISQTDAVSPMMSQGDIDILINEMLTGAKKI